VYDYHRGGVCGRVYVYQGGCTCIKALFFMSDLPLTKRFMDHYGEDSQDNLYCAFRTRGEEAQNVAISIFYCSRIPYLFLLYVANLSGLAGVFYERRIFSRSRRYLHSRRLVSISFQSRRRFYNYLITC
jgi:hypothetical protein